MKKYSNFSNYLDVITEILKSVDNKNISKLFLRLDDNFENGGRVFLAGNGGSASIASHAANDLNKLDKKGKSLNAISLNTNIPQLLANSNDYGFENIFVNQIKNYKPNEKDTLIGISSSGKSNNILNLLDFCAKAGTKTFSLLGFDGGEALHKSDYSIFFKSPINYYGPVEDLHMMLFHYYSHIIKKDISEIE